MRGSILKRFAVTTLAALVLASLASFALSYVYSSNEALESGAELAHSAYLVVESYCDCFDTDELLDSGSETYQTVHDGLRKISEIFKLDYISIYSVNEERTVRTYLYTAAADSDDDAQVSEILGPGAKSESPLVEQELFVLDNHLLDNEPYQISNRFGNTFAWFFPFFLGEEPEPLLACFELDVHSITRSVLDNTVAFAVPMLVIMVLLLALEMHHLRRDVVKPLRVVSSKMRSIVSDRARDPEPLSMGRNDEIGEIADSFNQMTTDIERYVNRLEVMTEERVTTSTELQVARRIQLGLVPETCDKSGPGFEASAMARAAREVGGDFYDLFVREDGQVCLVMADVSGKGVSAALFMAMCRTLIHEKLSRGTGPAQALNEANDSIERNNPEGMFVTVFAGVFNPAKRELRYANAGHTRPYVIDRGFLSPDPGIALGLFEDSGIAEGKIVLEPGEGILLYTDGATDAVNTQNVFFGEERIAQTVCDDDGAQTTVLGLVEAIDVFAAGREQFDDLTLLCLFVHAGDVWHWGLEPKLASFAKLRRGILELCGNSTATRRALLACDEAYSNVVNYSGATTIDVWALHEEGKLIVRLVDDGTAFNPLEHEKDDLEFEDLEGGGMGISLVKQVTSDLAYERTDERNVFTMTFELEE